MSTGSSLTFGAFHATVSLETTPSASLRGTDPDDALAVDSMAKIMR